MSYECCLKPDKGWFDEHIRSNTSALSDNVINDIYMEVRLNLICNVLNKSFSTYTDLKRTVNDLYKATVNIHNAKLVGEIDTSDEYCGIGEIILVGYGVQSPATDTQELIDTITENLYINLKCSPEYEYYNDSEMWWENFDEVRDMVDGFIQEISQNIDRELYQNSDKITE